MERYCVGEICDIKDFQSKDRDKEISFSTDYMRIASKVAGKDLTQFIEEEDHTDIFDGKFGEVPLFEGADLIRVYSCMLGNYPPLCDGSDQCEMMDEDEKAQVDERNKKQKRLENFQFITALKRCFLDPDYIYDILCDIYLTLLASEDRKELLFFKIKRRNRECPDSTADIDEGIENFIHNNKKRKTKRKDTIFDISGVKSTCKNTEVESLGIGVKRLWLFEKDFRNLFAKTQERFDKYDREKIICIIKQGAKCGLVYGVDDYMILEKLLGIDTCVYIYDIVQEMGEPDFNVLEPLIEVLMEYDGVYSRQGILSYLKCDLDMKRLHRFGFDEEELVKRYTEILWDEVALFNDRYKNVVDLYIREAQKKYTYRTVKKMIEDELIKGIMWKYEHQWKMMSEDQLKIAEDDENQLEGLFRDVYRQRYQQYESLVPKDTMRRIQGQIIVKNRERYEQRQRKG